MIAYESPYESPFADLIHPRHRKILADSVSNAIMSKRIFFFCFSVYFDGVGIIIGILLISVNMGKARFPLLEIGIGLLEEIVMDGQSGSRSKFGHGFAKVHRKSHNHASTSSAGSTLTPSHTASTSINIPSTSGVYATAVAATSSSSPTTRSTASGTGGLQYHRRHRHHHRSATSSLVVTSTTTTSTSAASVRTRNPLPLLASLPPPAVSSSSLRHRSSSSSNIGRRLRSTTVQSAPRDVLGPSTSAVSAGEIVDEEGSLNEVVVSGPGAGINWPEEVVATATAAASSADNEVDVALTVAEIETGGEIEEVLVFPEGGRRLRVDRYMSSGSSVQASHSPPSPPPPMGQNGTSIDVRVGGSELAGFFHPILFVPPMPH